ncbi:MAG: hypothetical protein ABMA64_37710 [Myxococcota bacterium]
MFTMLMLPGLAFAVDDDVDGVDDSKDNCLDLWNPDQYDKDADHIGDPCDAFPTIPFWTGELLDVRLDAAAAVIGGLVAGGSKLTLEPKVEDLLAGRCLVAITPTWATDPDGEPSRIATCWEIVDSYTSGKPYAYPKGSGPWGADGPLADPALVIEGSWAVRGPTITYAEVQVFAGTKVTATTRDTMLELYQTYGR